MAIKNNIRSIRFSDELAELIDHQQGDTFTQKFENLITQCVWELPEKEQELEKIERRIGEKREELQRMNDQVRKLRITINAMLPKALDLEKAIKKAVEKWDM